MLEGEGAARGGPLVLRKSGRVALTLSGFNGTIHSRAQASLSAVPCTCPPSRTHTPVALGNPAQGGVGGGEDGKKAPNGRRRASECLSLRHRSVPRQECRGPGRVQRARTAGGKSFRSCDKAAGSDADAKSPGLLAVGRKQIVLLVRPVAQRPSWQLLLHHKERVAASCTPRRAPSRNSLLPTVVTK